MQQPSRHYSRAPITEAIIDLKVILPGEVSIDDLASVGARVRDRFPIQEPIYEAAVLFQPEASVPLNATQHVNGFLFRSADKSRIFQVTLNGFTFNRLPQYVSWEEFRDDAKYLWEIYKDICKPEVVTRAAIRFINRLELPGPTLDLRDYLRIAPEVTPDLPQPQLGNFFMQLQLPQEECMLIVNEALVPSTKPGTISIILDFDLFREQNWNSDDDEVWSYLEKLRHVKNIAFEASITDKTRGLIA